MTTPLVHVGFPKCASTFLQNQLFPQSAGFHIGRDWGAQAFDSFVLTDAADFNPTQAAAHFRSPSGADELIPVVSNENLVGGAAARYDWLVPTAQRLASSFPEAKVVIVIREQRSMALSLYRQLVKRGESLRLDKAIRPAGRTGYYPRLRLERLRYDLALETYAELFGPDRVRVLPFERLVTDGEGFARELLSFGGGGGVTDVTSTDRRENVGYRGLTLEMRRRLNVSSAENYNGPGGPPWSFKAATRATRVIDAVIPQSAHSDWETSYRSAVADAVGLMFVESNRRLAARTGLDLAGMGYQL